MKYLLILMGLFSCAYADLDYYANPAEGWAVYNEPQEPKPHKIVQKHKVTNATIGTTSSVSNPYSASAQLATYNKEFQNTKADALLHPQNEQKVYKYMYAQRQRTVKATQFTISWQKVLLDHPELNYSILHPSNSTGIKAYDAQNNKMKAQLLKELADYYGIFFFYRGRNPIDTSMAQSVQSFAKGYGFEMAGVSTDGKFSKDIENNFKDQGQAKRMNISHFPAYVIYNKKNNQYRVFGYGEMSQTEMRDHIYDLVTNYKNTY